MQRFMHRLSVGLAPAPIAPPVAVRTHGDTLDGPVAPEAFPMVLTQVTEAAA
jgi:hypothetical protein